MKARLYRECPVYGLALALLSTLNPQLSTFAQGSLTPPGAPAPTMKTLQQIEARVPISSVPYAITSGGSYYLTTNLTGISGNAGISIQADQVTLDLNGFALIGVAGSLDGIRSPGGHTNLTIRNGTVRGWGWDGITMGNCRDSLLEQLHVSYSGGYGLAPGYGAVIRDCSASFNASDGIAANFGCTISSCTVSSNSGSGFSLGEGGILYHCTARNNFSAGIQVVDRGLVFENNCSANGVGIKLIGTANRVENNHVAGNGYGIYANIIPNLIIRNSATGNTTNYFIGSPVAYGPTNFVTGVITNQNPWANFAF